MKYFNRAFCVCLLLSAVLVFGFLVWGSFRPVSLATAQENKNYVGHLRNSFTSSSFGWLSIYENNFGICLLTFIPLFGVAEMLLVQYNTGLLVAGLARGYGVSNLLYLSALMLTPVFWMEYVCYVSSLAEGLFFLWLLAKERSSLKDWLRTHLGWTVLLAGLLLLLSAWVEWRFFL